MRSIGVQIFDILTACALTWLLIYVFTRDKKSRVITYVRSDNGLPQLKLLTLRNKLKQVIGLLNHLSLRDHEGVLLTNCRSIHTQGMLMHIDVVFLDDIQRCVHIESNIPPGVRKVKHRKARHVIELKAGVARSYFEVGRFVPMVQKYDENMP